ncbi:MAG: isopentenyl phosphate kinase [Bacteroidota bacterium]
MAELIFLKLGGSLITDKSRPYTVRLDMLDELCREIASARDGTQILVGHGSGSFGHTAASQYGTREGVSDERGWHGLAEVHYQAAALNGFVMQALRKAGIPALPFPPSACVTARDGQAAIWDIHPLERALAGGILPVTYGDVVLDEVRGGTILSTEDLFQYLAPHLRPSRILLAGLEPGVWADFPARTEILSEITPGSYATMRKRPGLAAGLDVTGGMDAKVRQMLKLVETVPGLKAVIFSAEHAADLGRALRSHPLGTAISL